MSNAIHLSDKQFEKHISSEQIAGRVEQIANEMNRAFAQSYPVFLPVLNGSFFFAADLMKRVDFEYEISFIKIASYSGLKSTDNIQTLIGFDENLARRNVVIIEDIIDTGKTMSELVKRLKEMHVSDIKIATLILKQGSLKYPVKPDFTGFEVENDFLVGYGLDYDKRGRHFKDIYKLI